MITVRDAKLDDAERILEIYDYYVKNTAISFEYEVPPIDEFKERMSRTMNYYPYLVISKNDKIEGYGYASPFINRSACDWSCEMSIYIDKNARRSGLGRRLYEEMEKALYNMRIHNLYACITYPKNNEKYITKNSAEFHEHMGYKKVGEFHNCGYKFGQWYNMIWMEKIIGKHKDNQKTVNYNKNKINKNNT